MWPSRRGEGVPPLRREAILASPRGEGVPPSNRGQDARDTQGPGSPNAFSSRLGTHDALATPEVLQVSTAQSESRYSTRASISSELK